MRSQNGMRESFFDIEIGRSQLLQHQEAAPVTRPYVEMILTPRAYIKNVETLLTPRPSQQYSRRHEGFQCNFHERPMNNNCITPRQHLHQGTYEGKNTPRLSHQYMEPGLTPRHSHQWSAGLVSTPRRSQQQDDWSSQGSLYSPPQVGLPRIDRVSLTIKEYLGSGTSATVHKASFENIYVAVKFLKEAQNPHTLPYQDFMHEVQVHADLSHPNIVTIMAANLRDPRPFIVYELMEGGTVGCSYIYGLLEILFWHDHRLGTMLRVQRMKILFAVYAYT
jgi:hypothetical protein